MLIKEMWYISVTYKQSLNLEANDTVNVNKNNILGQTLPPGLHSQPWTHNSCVMSHKFLISEMTMIFISKCYRDD